MNKVLDYSDVYLQPEYSEIKSRDDINQNTTFLGHNFINPVLPANMVCTISFELAKQFSLAGYFYILHRFYDYYDILKFILENQNLPNISISLGVKDKDHCLIDYIVADKTRVDFITIDISHGHHLLVKNMIEYIKKYLKETKIIAGNVTTKKACQDLKKWGADAVKVGLARGAACSTYGKTGVGSAGHFSTILECSKTGLPVIADGGVKTIGDISKSLVAGATISMVGGLFCACKDSPAQTIKPYVGSDTEYKLYYGSASSKNKGHNKYIEGESIWITPNNLTYFEFMEQINQGIRSTMSFGNFINVKDLKKMKYLCR